MSGLTLVTKGMIGCLNLPQRKRFEGGDGGDRRVRQPRVYYKDMDVKENKDFSVVVETTVEMELLEEENEDTTI